jgi:hypothetical protein
MCIPGAKDIELWFAGYVEGLASVIGHADRAGLFRDYCKGLVMPCERKSVEPMAAITAPERTATHSVVAAFCGSGRLIRRGGVGQRARDAAAAQPRDGRAQIYSQSGVRLITSSLTGCTGTGGSGKGSQQSGKRQHGPHQYVRR